MFLKFMSISFSLGGAYTLQAFQTKKTWAAYTDE